MTDFNHILNWRLLSGSHDFPGPDGGTCINEAAIIAAGFPYKSVQSADDCPPCFSRPLAAYLLGLNDIMPPNERQRLMPFVLRLAGSADTTEVEKQREDHICLETIRRVLPLALRSVPLEDHAKACETAPNLIEGIAGAAGAAWAAWAAGAAEAAGAAGAALCNIVIAIAEEAFAIGKQAEAIDTALIIDRMEAAKKLVAA